MHPLGLCNNNDEEDLYEYGWVGVVKLEQPELDPSCLTVLGKVMPPVGGASSDWLLGGYEITALEPAELVAMATGKPLITCFERENGGDYLVEETEIKELEGLEVPPAVISQTQRQAYKCDGPSSGYCGELKEK
ncbi:E3 ubiquitin-protein ligase ZNRF3-like [Tachysurus ichikawai]